MTGNKKRQLCWLALVALTVAPALSAGVLSERVPLETRRPASERPWHRDASWPQENWQAFGDLSRAEPIQPSPLVEVVGSIQGDPGNGKHLVGEGNPAGTCFACHVLPEADLPGNVGPNLSTIGAAGRSDEYLFNYINDPRSLNPDSVMPPWGARGLLSEAEIRDIVAYLKTLTEPAEFVGPFGDPDHRPIPVEDADNLDEFENPGILAVDAGMALYEEVCAACHPDPSEFDAWAAGMPKYAPRLGKMLGIEELITRHARATSGVEYPMGKSENVALATYLRYLANGARISLDDNDPGTRAALARGEILVRRKIGQLNFACIDCHQIAARRWIRGNYLPGMESMVDHFPAYRLSRGETWDIRTRMQWCNVSIRANELPPDAPEYGDIEVYLTKRNDGLRFSVPGLRN